MKPILFLPLLALCACTNIPELEGKEAPSLRTAPYPKLTPIEASLGAPVDPVSEAEEVEEDLIARGEALGERAEALQNAETN